MTAVAVNAIVPLYYGEVTQWYNVTDDEPHTGPFKGGRVYRASVQLTSGSPPGIPMPNAWYKWPATSFSVTVQNNGATVGAVSAINVTGGDVPGNVLRFDVTFPRTARIPVTSIQIDAAAAQTVLRNMSIDFGLILNDGALDDPIGISWSVSNPAFATVDDKGNVTILNRVGTVNLTASDPDSGYSHTIVLRII
jgi:hypothetical protein